MPRRPCYVLSLSLVTLAACHDVATGPTVAPGDLSPALAVTSNTWRKRIQMPSDRRFVIAATLDTPGGGSFLYAIGGQSMNSTHHCSSGLSKVQAYDGNSNTWSFKAPLPLPLQMSLAGVINGNIYVAGGCSGANQPEERLWEYDVAANQWTAKAFAPISLPHPVGSVLAGKLYVFDQCSWDACSWDGTATGLEQYTFFGFYDPATDRWTRLPLPPAGVWPIAGATFSGKLYFLGSIGRVHIYTPTTGAWTTGARRSEREVWWVTTAVVRSKWYVVGQERTSTGSNFLSVYDPAANTWVKRATPPAEYISDRGNGPRAGRVWAGGVARLELVGGRRPTNNWQYTP
jgi:Kelch motif